MCADRAPRLRRAVLNTHWRFQLAAVLAGSRLLVMVGCAQSGASLDVTPAPRILPGAGPGES